MKKVLMIVGSLRKNSFNLQLAKTVEEMLAGSAEVSFLEYSDIPFLNQDIEFPAPAAVESVRQSVLKADVIWIFTPEYNYQIPGVLKNLLDWLSRPLAANDWARGSAAKGKIVTISGVAGKSGAAGVRKHLSVLLEAMRMKLIGGMGVGVALDGEAFQTGKLKLTAENRAALQKQMEELLNAI